MEAILICIIILVTGACIGSFLNVVALRAISGESIVFPASKCPKCNTPIKWYDNIPVISYFCTFKGKCRNCGEKVSLQYPIIEALTAIIFLAVFLAYGFTVKTLLLLILLCLSIVISITDIKEESVYMRHVWLLIIAAFGTSLYLNGIENFLTPILGLITGIVIMEGVARFSYFLVKKDEKTTEETQVSKDEQDINEYVNKNKRAFGEGDTYIAAASGALLGWENFLVSLALAVALQALLIFPKFLVELYKQKYFRLLISLSSFLIVAVIYLIISRIMHINIYIYGELAFTAVLIIIATDIIKRMKETVNKQGFSSMPFGPAILIAMFVVYFWGVYLK